MVIRCSPARKTVSAWNYAISEPSALDLLVAPVQSTKAGLHSPIVALTRYGVKLKGKGVVRFTIREDCFTESGKKPANQSRKS